MSKKIKSEYAEMIEAIDAEIIDFISDDEAEAEYEDQYEEAKHRFGNVKLAHYEIWHDGGVGAKNISNYKVSQRLKSWTADGEDMRRMITFYMYKQGKKSKQMFALHRASDLENGFNLCGPVVFLPLTGDIEKGKEFLTYILEDLIDLRNEIKTILSKIAKIKE
jgi:hypothetical protein